MKGIIPGTAAGICGWSSGLFFGKSPRPVLPAVKPFARPRLFAGSTASPARPKPPALTVRPGALLPLDRLQQIHDRVVAEADQIIGSGQLWCARRVLVADGCTVTAPDTPENQKAYPQQAMQRPGCGFPILRLVVLLNLATGMLAGWATGNWFAHEVPLLQTLWDHLRPGDVLLADRGFCNWSLLAQCLQRHLDAVFRLKGSRRGDFRRGRRLSRDERLVQWRKPAQPAWTVSRKLWQQLPEVLTLRLVRCRLSQPGFRTRQVTLVTTLLDSQAFPPFKLAELYYRRWSMELSLRNLKTTLQMDQLSCKTPANLEREIRMHFLVHNLVRRLMLEAACRHHVPLQRVSFAGSLACARRYSEPCSKFAPHDNGAACSISCSGCWPKIQFPTAPDGVSREPSSAGPNLIRF
jgi:hypothetical protein